MPRPVSKVAVLLAALGPELPDDAACAGRGELFDPPGPDEGEQQVTYRRHAARRICAHCPALAACADTIDAFGRQPGSAGFVLGGRVVRGTTESGSAARRRTDDQHVADQQA